MKAGWATAPLAELCTVFADGDWIESKDQSPDGVRLIQTGNVGEGAFKDRGEKARYISEETFSRLRCTEIFEGDCLISRLPDPVGRSCLLPDTGERMITAVDCTIVRFNAARMQPEFFNYYSQSSDYLSIVDSETTGTTRKRISRSKLAQTPIPVPPLPEQQRIVAILDEAFAGITSARAHAEQNLQNVRELFESQLQAVFSRRGTGWKETTLGDVCVFENGDRGKNYPNRSEYVEAGVPWINTGHIQPDGTLSEEEMNYITIEKFDSLRSGKIQPGDLVYCLRGATLGKTALVDPLTFGAVASSLVILRPSQSLNNRFLYYFLTSPIGQRQIKTYENGAAQPNLGAKSVAKYAITLPDIAEQKRIVKDLDLLTLETQRLDSLYLRKLAALDELKQSLLHQAFSGQL